VFKRPGHFRRGTEPSEAVPVRLFDSVIEDLKRRFGFEAAVDHVIADCAL
jgi:hypothetical protein